MSVTGKVHKYQVHFNTGVSLLRPEKELNDLSYSIACSKIVVYSPGEDSENIGEALGIQTTSEAILEGSYFRP